MELFPALFLGRGSSFDASLWVMGLDDRAEITWMKSYFGVCYGEGGGRGEKEKV